jgi:myo-inositol-1(or 4)-monophosphatase
MSTNESPESLIHFIKNIARKAGKEILSFNRDELHTSKKGPRDLVTKADLASEKIITSAIKEHYPQHSVLAEEGSNALPTSVPEYLWVIDPIDGTANYAHNLSHSAVSIALLKSGAVHYGVVFNPFTDDLYHAVKGQGAYCNDKPIKTSQSSALVDTLVATGFPYKREDAVLKVITQRLQRVLNSCRDIRRLGAASLDCCLVACGKLDAYYECVQPWDIAAARLIVEEAGGKVGYTAASELNNSLFPELRSDNFLVAAPGVFEQIQSLLTI